MCNTPLVYIVCPLPWGFSSLKSQSFPQVCFSLMSSLFPPPYAYALYATFPPIYSLYLLGVFLGGSLTQLYMELSIRESFNITWPTRQYIVPSSLDMLTTYPFFLLSPFRVWRWSVSSSSQGKALSASTGLCCLLSGSDIYIPSATVTNRLTAHQIFWIWCIYSPVVTMFQVLKVLRDIWNFLTVRTTQWTTQSMLTLRAWSWEEE